MAYKALDLAVPTGSDLPSSLDEFINDTKEGFQVRLAVDHEFDLTGTVVDATTTTGGKHKQVTFTTAISTPGPDADQAILYIKDADHGKEINDELHFTSEVSGNEIQITDDDRLYIKVDDSTIENDASNGLQLIAAPAEGADADSTERALMIEGQYTGNTTLDRVIELGTGIIISSITIIKVGGTGAAGAIMVNSNPVMSRGIDDGADQTSRIIIDTDHSFKLLTVGTSGFNYNSNSIYYYSALCRRA